MRNRKLKKQLLFSLNIDIVQPALKPKTPTKLPFSPKTHQDIAAQKITRWIAPLSLWVFRYS